MSSNALTNHKIHLLDIVALVKDVPDEHLMRGSIGTVVEILADDVFLVEFADQEGRAYAMCPFHIAQLLKLHHEPALS